MEASSLQRVDKVNYHQIRVGFTLTEVLVVIGIIAILAAILLPFVKSAREGAMRTACVNKLKQMAPAYIMYADDNNGFLPPYWNESNFGWMEGLNVYMEGERDFFQSAWHRCPGAKRMTGIYDYNYRQNAFWDLTGFAGSQRWPDSTVRLSQFVNPSKAILNYCCWAHAGNPIEPINTHEKGRPVLYVDGHVESKAEYAKPLLYDLPYNDLTVY